MFRKLKLHNFTAFADAEFEFVDGVNAYVGANGCGKTHALKLLYGLQKHQFLAQDPERTERLDRVLMALFQPRALRQLMRRPSTSFCTVNAEWRRKEISLEIGRKVGLDVERLWSVETRPVFIPAKEVLGNAVNFLSAQERGLIDFDSTYRDILILAIPEITTSTSDELLPFVRDIQGVIGGTVALEAKSGRYFLRGRHGRLEFSLVAEGFRKLALLWILLMNGSLGPKSVLFWDEPESNLNPEMFPLVASILSMLASNGTQIHLASHSYAFLREMEFATRRKKASFRMFAIDRTPEGATVLASDRFATLKPNRILEEYERIYSLSIEEALRGG